MKKYIVSIGRQFGCGAHEIATKLSERLNVPYYDKEIIKRAAKDSGFDESIFKFYDEKPTRSFLYNVSTDGLSSFSGNGVPFEDQVFQYQFDSIRKVASEGSCVIVGRCADYILKGDPGLVTIFLHADDEFRLKRVTEIYGLDEKSAAKEIKAIDKKRARFHNFYSDEKWGDAATYDLAIDVSKLGIDETVELIAHYIETKYK
ncbi:MAG: cytidylate kinase-like family protein [Clostridiales bacterium]|nr:cytidylate kinase-like family protein [Clostridiales bacterium]